MAFPVVDEYRKVVVFDNLLRLRLRRVGEVLGTALETRLATARSASPRHGAESMILGAASTRIDSVVGGEVDGMVTLKDGEAHVPDRRR